MTGSKPYVHAWRIPPELLGASHPEWLDAHIARGDVWVRMTPRRVAYKIHFAGVKQPEPLDAAEGDWLVQREDGSLESCADWQFHDHWCPVETDAELRATEIEKMVEAEHLTLTDDHAAVLRACTGAGCAALAVCELLTPGSAAADHATFHAAALRAAAVLSQLGRWEFIRLREPFSRVRVTTERGAAALAAHVSSGR